MIYAGADWMRESARVTLSPLGEKVADILGVAFRGIYHVPQSALLHKRVKWGSPRYIELVVCGCLSTFDFDHLTTLVVLAHEMAVRVVVQGRANGYLALGFSPRQRDGGVSERHPTIEAAIERVRKAAGDSE